MSTTGGFLGDPVEALNPPASEGGCCGGPASGGTCCGTVADAEADGGCCGTAAKEEAVASGAGCCG